MAARLRHILQLIHRNPPKPPTSNNGRYTSRGICAHPRLRITDRGLAMSLAGYHADCRSVGAPDYMLRVRMRLTIATVDCRQNFSRSSRDLVYICCAYIYKQDLANCVKSFADSQRLRSLITYIYTSSRNAIRLKLKSEYHYFS